MRKISLFFKILATIICIIFILLYVYWLIKDWEGINLYIIMFHSLILSTLWSEKFYTPNVFIISMMLSALCGRYIAKVCMNDIFEYTDLFVVMICLIPLVSVLIDYAYKRLKAKGVRK